MYFDISTLSLFHHATEGQANHGQFDLCGEKGEAKCDEKLMGVKNLDMKKRGRERVTFGTISSGKVHT